LRTSATLLEDSDRAARPHGHPDPPGWPSFYHCEFLARPCQLGSSSTPRATNTGWPLIGSFSTTPTTRNGLVGLLLRSLRLFSPPPNRVNGVTYTLTGPLNSTPASPFELT